MRKTLVAIIMAEILSLRLPKRLPCAFGEHWTCDFGHYDFAVQHQDKAIRIGLQQTLKRWLWHLMDPNRPKTEIGRKLLSLFLKSWATAFVWANWWSLWSNVFLNKYGHASLYVVTLYCANLQDRIDDETNTGWSNLTFDLDVWFSHTTWNETAIEAKWP